MSEHDFIEWLRGYLEQFEGIADWNPSTAQNQAVVGFDRIKEKLKEVVPDSIVNRSPNYPTDTRVFSRDLNIKDDGHEAVSLLDGPKPNTTNNLYHRYMTHAGAMHYPNNEAV